MNLYVRSRVKGVAHSTASVNGSPDAAVRQGDECVNVVYVGVGATREHGAAAGEPEPVALHLNPVLDRLLDAELLVGDVVVPGVVPALGPPEGRLVVGRRRHEAPDGLVFPGAVPLPVHQHRPLEPPPARPVLARRVLAEI